MTLKEKIRDYYILGKKLKEIRFEPIGKCISHILPQIPQTFVSRVTGKTITRLNQDFISNGWNLSEIKVDPLLIVARIIFMNGDKRTSGIFLIKIFFPK